MGNKQKHLEIEKTGTNIQENIEKIPDYQLELS